MVVLATDKYAQWNEFTEVKQMNYTELLSPWPLKDEAESKISALQTKVTLMRSLLRTVGCRVVRASNRC